jgi:hypothetical protein
MFNRYNLAICLLSLFSGTTQAAVGDRLRGFTHPKLLHDNDLAIANVESEEFIVVLNSDNMKTKSASETAKELLGSHFRFADKNVSKSDGPLIFQVFEDVFKGFTVKGLAMAKLSTILGDDVVKYVEPVSTNKSNYEPCFNLNQRCS